MRAVSVPGSGLAWTQAVPGILTLGVGPGHLICTVFVGDRLTARRQTGRLIYAEFNLHMRMHAMGRLVCTCEGLDGRRAEHSLARAPSSSRVETNGITATK